MPKVRARRPCLSAFMAERALPSGVLGPRLALGTWSGNGGGTPSAKTSGERVASGMAQGPADGRHGRGYHLLGIHTMTTSMRAGYTITLGARRAWCQGNGRHRCLALLPT